MRTVLAAALLVLAVSPAAAFQIPDDLDIDIDNVPGGREQLICLALNDYWEARGESLRGRMAVAKVVLNRLRDPRYPDDVCSVVKEHKAPEHYNACQFSWHCDGRSDKPRDIEAWRRSLLLAAALLRAKDAVEDPTGGALWYHARSVRPAWTRRLVMATEIGGHIFYREPKTPPLPRRPPAGLRAVQVAAAEAPPADGADVPVLPVRPPPRLRADFQAPKPDAGLPARLVEGVVVTADFKRVPFRRTGRVEQVAVAR